MEIDKIIETGIEKKASDIHLVKGKRPILRINRDLIELGEFNELKNEDVFWIYDHFLGGNLELHAIFEREKKLDLNYEFSNMRLRVNISKSNGHPIFTIRIIKRDLPKFNELGLPEIVKKIARLPQGLMLVTGKSNSGKTTTLNALVNEINKTENKKILMLENPIEYMHESDKSLIIQKEISEGGDCPTFGKGATNALREDCDILVIRRNKRQGNYGCCLRNG